MMLSWTEVTREVLQRDYPEACVVVVSPNEVIAELGEGEAVVVVNTIGSRRHFHLEAWETYEVLDGTLAIEIAGIGHVLQKGETLGFVVGAIHKTVGVGSQATFKVKSKPPWSSDDHFEV
jgi:mannose-6-phosphate isomerase-like protein (cupin superfamily)